MSEAAVEKQQMEGRGISNSMVFDGLTLEYGGMLATNGHSLYKSRDVIMDCLDKIFADFEVTSQPLITVADVGTSDGSTSLNLLNDIIDKIRVDSGQCRELMIYYTDLPGNNFNRMFSVLQAGLHFGPDVFYAAVGRTMFEKCLPDNSTDLIFSSIAAMYLSKRPCQLKDGCYPRQENLEEMKAYHDQATLDWKTFLVMRGRELRRGGYLVVLNIGITKQGETTIHLKGGFGTLGHVLKRMVADGLITEDEFLDCNTLFELNRTEDDYALPFTENDKDLLETGLELVSTRSFVNKLNHPSFEVADKDDATKTVYADRIVAGIKPWLYAIVYNGLSDRRSQRERESLAEIYFSRLWDFAYQNDDQIPQLALVEIVAKKHA
ncbi:benzoate carboxyl methyltransferase-like [Pecten maximus]|uniref:benzoate carboxyl methyltransferase-like n=1 Tax=Pecten maximus TaxID=6579 RepID=UPI001457F67D|nr:benzoate carboxyl methyltransferase-like [Pecten maximus]